jgi:hypothetical protein
MKIHGRACGKVKFVFDSWLQDRRWYARCDDHSFKGCLWRDWDDAKDELIEHALRTGECLLQKK